MRALASGSVVVLSHWCLVCASFVVKEKSFFVLHASSESAVLFTLTPTRKDTSNSDFVVCCSFVPLSSFDASESLSCFSSSLLPFSQLILNQSSSLTAAPIHGSRQDVVAGLLNVSSTRQPSGRQRRRRRAKPEKVDRPHRRRLRCRHRPRCREPGGCPPTTYAASAQTAPPTSPPRPPPQLPPRQLPPPPPQPRRQPAYRLGLSRTRLNIPSSWVRG